MYLMFLSAIITIVSYFTGWLFKFWVGCSLCCLIIWICAYWKSINDYAHLSTERWRMLILFDEMRTQGFDTTMEQSYYFLSGMRTHWIILSSYIRKLHLYSISQTHWFTRQWIAKMPPDLTLSILELDVQRELCSTDILDPMLTVTDTTVSSSRLRK